MAELTEEMREKLFVEIITSSKEYTKENITDPKRVKSGILSILRTHRPVKLVDYEYGLSHALMKDYQIIVKEKEDKSKVRVYCKNKKYFYCVKYRQRLNNCSSNLKFKCGILFAAIHHRNKCEAKDYSVVQKIQDLLKQGKNGKALALTFRKNESQNRSPNYDPFLSLSTSIRNDTTGSTPTDGENEMNLEEWFSEQTATSSDTTYEHSSFSPAARSSVKSEIDDPAYCMVFAEPPAKRPKTESSNSEETVAFDHPSASILKKVCGKLNIEYSHDAYQLWANIIFNDISASSNNIQTHELKSSNIYACLSLFFTGKIDNCFLIQHVINTAHRGDLITSDSLTQAEIDEIFTSATVTDEQIEFIASFLSCRIGIYHGPNLNKYGNWKDENIALTLILSFIDGMYSIVLDL